MAEPARKLTFAEYLQQERTSETKHEFLDGHVYVHPAVPGKVYELTVLGDLHGCYSCLKSALLQADFFAKLEAWKTTVWSSVTSTEIGKSNAPMPRNSGIRRRYMRSAAARI